MPFNKSHIKDILDSLGEGVYTVDKDFKITFLNRAAEKITGFQRDTVIGKFCKQVFQSDLCIDCPISKILKSGKNLYDLPANIRNKDGDKFSVRINAALLRKDENQEPIGGVVSFRDLSELDIVKSRLQSKNIFYNMLGRSKAMHEIFRLIEQISESKASVLIQGESGTGKEMVAEAIHATSLRKKNALIKVNCAVFPPLLLASELFGHVKGAFTGAIKDRKGRFEIAHRGSLFLDEIGEMPPEMQAQLLRVLEEGTFEQIGSSVTRKVDVRIIAATNTNLKKVISQGRFREDLFYRFNVIPIIIPPLRERPEDLPFLIQHFVKKHSILAKKSIDEIEHATMDLLLSYPWPGNVRELENSIEYAIARAKEPIIKTEILPPTLRKPSLPLPNASGTSSNNHTSDFHKRLHHLLEKHHWNRTLVAKELAISRTTLWRIMKKLRARS